MTGRDLKKIFDGLGQGSEKESSEAILLGLATPYPVSFVLFGESVATVPYIFVGLPTSF